MPINNTYQETEEERQRKRAKAPTNFTNFSRYFAGNGAVAAREATKYADQAQTAAEKANQSTEKVRRDFNTNVGNGSVASNPFGIGNAAMSAAQEAEMKTNAGAVYTGPMGLGDVEGVEQAHADANAAEQQLAGLGLVGKGGLDANGNARGDLQTLIQQNSTGGYGASALSGALVGTAGRKNFDSLRAQFAPETVLRKAEEEAEATGLKAKEDSKNNADSWAQLSKRRADQTVAQKAADDALRTKEEAEYQTALKAVPISKLNDPLAGVDKRNPEAVKAAKAQFEQFRMAVQKDAGDEFRTAMHAASPITNLWGDVFKNSGTTPIEGMGNDLGKGLHAGDTTKKANGGGEYTGQHIPWRYESDWPVFRSMSPTDWAALRGMNTHAQVRWINNRLGEIYQAAAKNPEPLPTK